MGTCFYCGGQLLEEMGTFVHEEGGQVWAIRNVPTWVCRQCGEKEYSQGTTELLLEILKQPPRPKEILQVPAYDLAAR